MTSSVCVGTFRSRKCFLFRLQRCNVRNRRIQWAGTRCTLRMHTIPSCRTNASMDTQWSARRPGVAGQIENGPERHLPARRLIAVHLVFCTTVGLRISRRVSRTMEERRKFFAVFINNRVVTRINNSRSLWECCNYFAVETVWYAENIVERILYRYWFGKCRRFIRYRVDKVLLETYLFK